MKFPTSLISCCVDLHPHLLLSFWFFLGSGSGSRCIPRREAAPAVESMKSL
jgi:hypothetical protein